MTDTFQVLYDWGPIILGAALGFVFWYYPSPRVSRESEEKLHAVLSEHVGPRLPRHMGLRTLGGPVILYGSPPEWQMDRLRGFVRTTNLANYVMGLATGTVFALLTLVWWWWSQFGGVPVWMLTSGVGAALVLVAGTSMLRRAPGVFDRPLMASEREAEERRAMRDLSKAMPGWRPKGAEQTDSAGNIREGPVDEVRETET